MRLLITFIFLIFMQSFVICTEADGRLNFLSKSADKLGESKQLTELISIQESKELVFIRSLQILNSIHQPRCNDYPLNKDKHLTKNSLLFSSYKSTLEIKEQVNFSLLYIFNCLYPKYTFW